MRQRHVFTPLILTLLFVFSGAAVAQEQTDKSSLEGFDDFVSGLLEVWKVPGLAIAVVKDGEIILSKGYGYRDLENKLDVTPKTLFAIGSSTKAFTVATLAILVDEGKMEWDKPVQDYLPGFRLYDEYASTHMTPRDLVTHRSGLPRHDLMWYGSPFSRKQIFDRLRFLEPNKGFRDVFQYQNLMFMTAGYLSGQLNGSAWEVVIKEKIFKPLGMTSSNLSVIDSQKADDFALPYQEEDEELTKIDFRNIDAVGPAGSINSNVEDMIKWVALHLNNGKVGEEQLISEGNIAEMHTQMMAIRRKPQYAERPMVGYGMGWFIEPYRGHNLIHHGGAIDGFRALVSFMPQDNIGLVILINRSGTAVPTIVSYNIFDRLLGLDKIDWHQRIWDEVQKAKETADKAEEDKDKNRKADTTPSHGLADYAGRFEHEAYGIVQVDLEGETLRLAYNGMSSALEHYHYDVFRTSEGEIKGLMITFVLNEKGDVDQLSVTLEQSVKPIVFTRIGEESMSNPEFLNRFVGEYEIGTIVAKVVLRSDNVLTLTVPGQPTYELEPVKGTEFRLKGLEGYSLEFKLDNEMASEVTFNQPNGTFTASRKVEVKQ